MKNLASIDVYKNANLIVQINGFCDKEEKCIGCYSFFCKEVLNIERYLSIIDTFKKGDLIVLRGGEPTLVKDWFRKYVSPAIERGLRVVIETDGYFIGKDDYHELLPELSHRNIFMRISFDYSHNPPFEDFNRMAFFANDALSCGIQFGFYSLGMDRKQIEDFVEGTKLEEFLRFFHTLKFYKKISMVKLNGFYLRADGDFLKRIIEIKNKDTSKVYDKIAEKYNLNYFKTADYISKFLELIHKNGKILDIGCGTGVNSNFVKQRGFNVIGIDSSYRMIKIAKQNFPQINFKLADMRKLKFENESFDGVFASYSLIHITKVEISSLISNLGKFLKSDGIFYLSLQVGNSKERFIDAPFKKSEKLFINIMSFSEIRRILENNGFKIIFKNQRSPVDGEIKFNKLFIIAQKKPE